MARPLNTAGQSLILNFEGTVLYPYDDHDGKRLHKVFNTWVRVDGSPCIGYPTIGVGCRIFGDWSPSEITREQAMAMFADQRLPSYVAAVDAAMPGANDNQRNAAASFCWNCGPGGLVSSGIPAAFRAGQDPTELWLARKWSCSKGVFWPALALRRAKELALYLTPVPVTEAERTEVLAEQIKIDPEDFRGTVDDSQPD